MVPAPTFGFGLVSCALNEGVAHLHLSCHLARKVWQFFTRSLLAAASARLMTCPYPPAQALKQQRSPPLSLGTFGKAAML
jgi:hypothetical protein